MIEKIENLNRTEIEEIQNESETAGHHFITKMMHQWEQGENRFAKQNEILISYKKNGRIIGIGGINEDPYVNNSKYGRLRHVYVLKKFRRQGIGKAIVNHLFSFIKAHYEFITLRVPSDGSADLFYSALNFSAVKDLESVTHIMKLNQNSEEEGEQWDIFNSDGIKTGKKVRRGDPMLQTEYHLVVHIWIQNLKGQYLISQRTPNKTFPNLWESTGGSALAGEESLQAALREVKEELGIQLNEGKGKLIFRKRRQHHDYPDFLDVWKFVQDVDIKTVTFQENEVKDAKWATKEEIYRMLNAGVFVANLKYIMDCVDL